MDTLAPLLRSSLADIAQANNVEELPPQTRAVFGLQVPENPQTSDSPQPDMHTEFYTLKALVSKEDGVDGNRIDVLVQEFQRFIEPLRRYGVADPADLVKLGIKPDTKLTIFRKDHPGSWEVVLSGGRFDRGTAQGYGPSGGAVSRLSRTRAAERLISNAG